MYFYPKRSGLNDGEESPEGLYESAPEGADTAVCMSLDCQATGPNPTLTALRNVGGSNTNQTSDWLKYGLIAAGVFVALKVLSR